ncbi:MAG: hypothetical protein OCD01_04385 [Fibrobacterales bacterium]
MIRSSILMIILVVSSLLVVGCFVSSPKYETFVPAAPPSARGIVEFTGYSNDTLRLEIPTVWNTLEGTRNLYAFIPAVLSFDTEYLYTGVILSTLTMSEYTIPSHILINANGNSSDDILSNVQLIDSTQFAQGYTLRYSALHQQAEVWFYDIVIPLEGKGYLIRFMCDIAQSIELPDLDQVRSSIAITLSTVELSYGSGWFMNDTNAALIYDRNVNWNSDNGDPSITMTMHDTFAIQIKSNDPMEMNRAVRCEFMNQTIAAEENICSGIATGNTGVVDTLVVYSVNPMTAAPGDTFKLVVEYEVSTPIPLVTIAESTIHPNARIKVAARGYKNTQYNGLGDFALWSSQGDTLIQLENLLGREALLQDTTVSLDYTVPEGVDSITFILEVQDVDAITDTLTKTVKIEAHVFDTLRLAGITDSDFIEMAFPDSWKYSKVDNGHEFKNSFYSGFSGSYDSEDVKSACVYQTVKGSGYTSISNTYLSDVGARSGQVITDLIVVDSSNAEGLKRVEYSGSVLERGFVFYDVLRGVSDWNHLIRCYGEERNKLELAEVVDSLVSSLVIEYPAIEVTFSNVIINNDTSLSTPSFYRTNDTLSYVVTITDTLNGEFEVVCSMGDSTKAIVGDTCNGLVTTIGGELAVLVTDPLGVTKEYREAIDVRESWIRGRFESGTSPWVYAGAPTKVLFSAYDSYDHSSFKRIYVTIDNGTVLFDGTGVDADSIHSYGSTHLLEYEAPDDVGFYNYILEVTNDRDSVVADTFEFQIMP